LKNGENEVSFTYDGTSYTGTVTYTAPVTDLTVTKVGAINTINVDYGTIAGAINLPENAEVTLSDSTTTNAAVTWDKSNYDGTVADTYTLTGTLTMPEGITNPDSLTANVDVVVNEQPDNEPIIDFTKNIDNSRVTLTGSVTDNNGSISELTIDWGDGSTDTITNNFDSINQNHTYSNSGDYVVIITATDNDGASSSKEINITFYKLTITIAIESEGSITPNEGIHIYEDGTKVSITAEPNRGYHFDHWEGDINDTETSQTFKIMNDLNIKAVFKKLENSLKAVIQPINTIDNAIFGYGFYVYNESNKEIKINRIDVFNNNGERVTGFVSSHIINQNSLSPDTSIGIVNDDIIPTTLEDVSSAYILVFAEYDGYEFEITGPFNMYDSTNYKELDPDGVYNISVSSLLRAW
jgi:hypothetical protein